MVSHEVWLPSYEELKVPHEIQLSTPALWASAPYMNKYCESICKEFMLCRSEWRDPRKCLDLGSQVTACGIQFLQKLKKGCAVEFENFAHCIDYVDGGFTVAKCRVPQRAYDDCVREKLGMSRPELGYFAKPHVIKTDRPPVEEFERDYEAEARALSDRFGKQQSEYRRDPKLYNFTFVDMYKPEMH